jgi:hypothetical protein
LWLEELSDEVRPALPLADLLGWLVRHHPERDTADVLAGFTRLVFDPEFSARFTDNAPVAYESSDGRLEANPVELIAP